MRSRQRERSPVRFKASFMAPRGRESTRPGFPKLISQQTEPFNPDHPPAAFPSLPLMSKQVRQSESIPHRSSNVDTIDTSDQDNEEVDTSLSSDTVSEADTSDSSSIDSRDSSVSISSCESQLFLLTRTHRHVSLGLLLNHPVNTLSSSSF